VNPRRRRGLLLLCVALASGGLAASQVHERERRAAERLGPQVEVLVAARDIPAGARVARGALGVRRVPVRFVPPDALPSAEAVVGTRTAAAVAAGGYLTASLFKDGNQGHDGGLRRGERTVTVEVAGGSAVGALRRGARVDVLVSTETGAEGGRTTMALAGAELLRVAASGAAAYGSAEPVDGAPAPDPTASGPTALATLRVSLEQAIYLTAADNFAREIRLMPRPPGDHSRAGGTVSQGQL
jgi:pilus assembly protein CpaB